MWTPGAVPAPLNQFVNFVGDKYQPVVFYNDYWNLAKDYHPVGVENRCVVIDNGVLNGVLKIGREIWHMLKKCQNIGINFGTC